MIFVCVLYSNHLCRKIDLNYLPISLDVCYILYYRNIVFGIFKVYIMSKIDRFQTS